MLVIFGFLINRTSVREIRIAKFIVALRIKICNGNKNEGIMMKFVIGTMCVYISEHNRTDSIDNHFVYCFMHSKGYVLMS